MNNKVTHIFALTIGAAIGSVVTWKLVKKTYEKLAQEEIESVRAVYEKKTTVLTNEVQKAQELLKWNEDHDIVPGYEKIVDGEGYAKKEKGDDEVINEQHDESIYVISPDEFDELGYETVSLNYYADGVLAYDSDKVVENSEGLVGSDWPNRFGEYEADSVFVRNDKKRIDFEILKDVRTYSAVVGPRDED